MKSIFLSVLSTSIIAGSALAGTMGEARIFPSALSTMVMTASIGADFANQAKGQTLSLLPPFQNHYTVDSKQRATIDGGLFLGMERRITDRVNGQLGIAGYVASSSKVSGHVWQFAIPEFDNLTYRYRIHNQRVMVSGKLLGMGHQALHPYLSGELGIGFNRARRYQETTLGAGGVAIAPFANYSSTSFSYATGAGVEWQFDDNLRLGVGYQFADLGKVSLGLSPAAMTADTLQIAHRYTNQVRLQLTYLI